MDSHEAPQPAPRLLDQLGARIRALHYSIRTEEQYVQWIKRFVVVHNMRHRTEIRDAHLEAFLTPLAVEGYGAGWGGTFALCARTEVLERREGMGTAVRLPRESGVERPAHRCCASTSS